mgnify:CR=1 FL=1
MELETILAGLVGGMVAGMLGGCMWPLAIVTVRLRRGLLA